MFVQIPASHRKALFLFLSLRSRKQSDNIRLRATHMQDGFAMAGASLRTLIVRAISFEPFSPTCILSSCFQWDRNLAR
jgi:hypothetical protein